MYILSIVFLIFLVLLKLETKKTNPANIDMLSLFVLIFVSAFSYHNGWDSYNYKGFFDSIVAGGWDVVTTYSLFGLEFGYLTYLYLMSLLTSEYQVVVIVQSVFLNVIIFSAIRRLKFNYTLFALLFFSSFFIKFELSTIRQGIAVAIVTLSYKHLIFQNFRKFTTTILIASLFHYSALIMLIFYFFNKINISRKFAINLAVFALPAFFLALMAKDFVFILLSDSPLSGIPVANKIIAYFSKSNNTGLPLIQLFSLALYIYFCVFLYDHKDPRSKLTISLFTFLIVIQFYSKMLPSLLLVRLEYYFIFSQLFIWLLLFEKLSIKNKIPNILLLIIIIPFFNLYISLRNPYDRQAYLPYYSYIEFVFFDKKTRSKAALEKLAKGYK